MRADIHHGPEQELHLKAGYISARPTSSSPKASCDARPVHTYGSLGDMGTPRTDVSENSPEPEAEPRRFSVAEVPPSGPSLLRVRTSPTHLV